MFLKRVKSCYQRRLQILNEATDAILSVDVGKYEIATGSADDYLRVYNVRDGTMTMGNFQLI